MIKLKNQYNDQKIERAEHVLNFIADNIGYREFTRDELIRLRILKELNVSFITTYNYLGECLRYLTQIDYIWSVPGHQMQLTDKCKLPVKTDNNVASFEKNIV